MGLAHVCLLFSFIGLSLAGSFWKPCIGTKVTGQIESVAVGGCKETASSCSLIKGTNATVTVTFMTARVDTKAKADVHGIIGGIHVPFPVHHPDACTDKDSGVYPCPLKANTKFVYHHAVEVKALYPDIQLLVEWKLEDLPTNIFCFVLNAKIVSA